MIIYTNEVKIKFTNEVLSEIYNWRQSSYEDFEAGGMLIGSIIKDTQDIIIEDYTIPMKWDFRSRIRFDRSESHNKLLKEKWVESQYTKMYFGEWHTHPQNNPNYSCQDIDNWALLMQNSKTETNFLIFLIAGISRYKIWLGNRNKQSIELIGEVNFDEFKVP